LLELRSAVLGLLLPILLIVVFWFLLMRPQQKRQAALRQLQSALAPGEDVLLTSGVYATVVEITDDHVLVSIAPGVEIRVVRAAIGNVIPKPEPEIAEPIDGETTDAEPGHIETTDVEGTEAPTKAEDN
jgi:preprotein translocase subunit YajC